MYRVLIADDEGIMRDALENIIKSHYGNECELAFAKTGRAVVEIAETFRPDIAFIDIQMPGINGIQAMKEIRKFNSMVYFIIITAYDKFAYAKEAINLGVFEYLTKPVKRSVVLEVLDQAIQQINKERKKRSDNLKIQEKLETVIPIVENGFVNSLIIQEEETMDFSYYRTLLDIQEEYGYAILIQFGRVSDNRLLTTPVGMSVKIQSVYPQISAACKEFFPCIVGPIMTNRFVLIVRSQDGEQDYNSRIKIIEQARNLVHRLAKIFDATFRAGIGNVYSMEELRASYSEAFHALSRSNGSVAHVADIMVRPEYVGDYPAELERKMFSNITKGNWNLARQSTSEFFDWMIHHYYEEEADIKLKVLEIVMRAEYEGFLKGGTNSYSFLSRKDYLKEVLNCADYSALKKWFLDKIEIVCKKNGQKQENLTESVVSKAMAYIKENFSKELSLDEVSRTVNVSPYYFSKLFKEKSGQNFIEYLTSIRIDYAKKLLMNPNLSIKEICIMSGYSDPNYFSRIFKKQEDVTPSEYREQLKEKNE